MKILDAHAHIGDSVISDFETTEEELLAGMDEAGIREAIVQPHPYPTDVMANLARIADAVKRHDGRLHGLVSLNPHIHAATYRDVVKRYVEEFGFVGVKIHPLGHAVSLSSRAARLVLNTARELRIPVMIHTGIGVPFSLPSLALPVAREYPDLKIILAHAGAGFYSAEALIVAKECPNVYLETSWCYAHDIRRMIRELGAERVMLGSDLPSNVPIEMAKYNSLSLDEHAREMCLGGTARQVFGIGL